MRIRHNRAAVVFSELRFGGTIFAALLALCGGLAVPVAANAQQAGEWRAAMTGPRPIATSGQGISLLCGPQAPILVLNLVPAPDASGPISVSIRIDGTDHTLALTRNGEVWAAFVQDRTLIDALAAGTTAQMVVEGTPRGAVSLMGSAAAFRSALAPCYAAAQAGSAMAAESGLMDRVPIRLGYYMDEEEAGGCRRATHFIKYEHDRYVEIYGSERETEGFAWRLSRILGPDAEDFYALVVDQSQEDGGATESYTDQDFLSVRPAGAGRIEISYQDSSFQTWCAEDQVPERFRR